MNHSGTSPVAKAVRSAVEKNGIYETHYDPCECNPSSCKLSRGLEGLFVADIASRLHQEIQKHEHDWAFHEFVYMPSTKIEKKCGFDVSFGHFEREPKLRVRLMHKLQRNWCDTKWKWNSKSYRSSDHISKLVAQSRNSAGKIRPYVSFSVCYCLHEHRRMGRNDVPAFEDARRTLFVDLSPLREVFPEGFDCKNPAEWLEVVHSPEQGGLPFSARWVSAHGQVPLKVSNWADFSKTAVEFLRGNN